MNTRRLLIIAAGVFDILFGVLMIVEGINNFVMVKTGRGAIPIPMRLQLWGFSVQSGVALVAPPRVMVGLASVIMEGLGVLSLSAGIGVLMLRHWARLLAVTVAVIIAGLSGLLVIGVMLECGLQAMRWLDRGVLFAVIAWSGFSVWYLTQPDRLRRRGLIWQRH